MEQDNLEILVRSWPKMQIKFTETLDSNTGIIVEIKHFHIFESGGYEVQVPNTFKAAVRNMDELINFFKQTIREPLEEKIKV